MVSNHAFIEIQNKELLNEEHPEEILIRYIKEMLEAIGVECGEIKILAFYVGFICIIDNNEIGINLSKTEKREEGTSGYSSIFCVNAIKSFWWKRLFKQIPTDMLDSGKELQYVCEQIDKILSSDSRIGNVHWMTREEKRKRKN